MSVRQDEAYESKSRIFLEEHMHGDEGIRHVLNGSGYSDLRHRQLNSTVQTRGLAYTLLPENCSSCWPASFIA
ncbi:hypothetical protein PENSPDRAFT_656725 [Peniophora sp. CONT]|nr:hypothetical protein PENSPDRAFT_656725 [Peniophora sp. CONT]